MGGGDLNLKKAWHPAKLENMQKVYEAEQKHKEEQRKMETLRKEIAQERELADLQQMQEAAGLVSKKTERLDWLYTGAANISHSGVQEDYLLGKKKATDILSGKEEVVPNSLVEKRNMTLKSKDLESKIREDPLFIIKKKQSLSRSGAIQKKRYP